MLALELKLFLINLVILFEEITDETHCVACIFGSFDENHSFFSNIFNYDVIFDQFDDILIKFVLKFDFAQIDRFWSSLFENACSTFEFFLFIKFDIYRHFRFILNEFNFDNCKNIFKHLTSFMDGFLNFLLQRQTVSNVFANLGKSNENLFFGITFWNVVDVFGNFISVSFD